MISPGQKQDFLHYHQKIFPAVEAILPRLHVIATVHFPNARFSRFILMFFFLEYFHGLLQRAPVILPQTTPIYSNTAFRILGYILEAISKTPFDKLLDSSVLQPLNLTTTSYGIPAEGSWVIPNGDSAWYQNTGDETP